MARAGVLWLHCFSLVRCWALEELLDFEIFPQAKAPLGGRERPTFLPFCLSFGLENEGILFRVPTIIDYKVINEYRYYFTKTSTGIDDVRKAGIEGVDDCDLLYYWYCLPV